MNGFFAFLTAIGLAGTVVLGAGALTNGDEQTINTRRGDCFITEKIKYDWFKANTISTKVECLTPEDKAEYDQLIELEKKYKEKDLD